MIQIQEVVTYCVVAIAGVIVLFGLYKTVFPAHNSQQSGGCSSGCNCDAKEMRKELLGKKG